MECSRRRAVSSVSASGTRRAARASSRRAAQLLASRRTHLHAHAPRVRSGYSSDCCPTVETCSGCTLCRTSHKALSSTHSATVAFGLVESCAVRLLGAGGRFAVRMCRLQRARSQGAATPMCSVARRLDATRTTRHVQRSMRRLAYATEARCSRWPVCCCAGGCQAS